jgi:hypothetical protein
MHLADVDFRTAVAWLQQHLAASPPTSGEPATHAPSGRPAVPLPERPGRLRLPLADDRLLGQVCHGARI